jgi:hypothetical protein
MPSEKDRQRLNFVLQQIQSTQLQFYNHDCLDLLTGEAMPNSGPFDPCLLTNWIETERYVNDHENQPLKMSGYQDSLLDLLTKVSFQHA